MRSEAFPLCLRIAGPNCETELRFKFRQRRKKEFRPDAVDSIALEKFGNLCEGFFRSFLRLINESRRRFRTVPAGRR